MTIPEFNRTDLNRSKQRAQRSQWRIVKSIPLCFLCFLLFKSSAADVTILQLPLTNNVTSADYVPIWANAKTYRASLGTLWEALPLDETVLQLSGGTLTGADGASWTNVVLAGNVRFRSVNLGSVSNTVNIDAALAGTFLLTLTGDTTVGLTNWADDHFVTLVTIQGGGGTNTLTITNVVYYLEVGSNVQPTNDWGLGIGNEFGLRKINLLILGSRHGIMTP